MTGYKLYMIRVVCCFFCLVSMRPGQLFAQKDGATFKNFRTEREKFVQVLHSATSDTTIVLPIGRYFEKEINKTYSYIRSVQGLNTSERDKAVRSLVYFIKELNNAVAQMKLDIYNVPVAVRSYNSVLRALINHKPLLPVLRELGSAESQVIASAFSQYKEFSMFDDVAVYKRVAATPEFILQFLESKPGFRFADSLLMDAAVFDPLKMAYYLQKSKGDISGRIRGSDNIYLRQIAMLSGDKNASEYLPFISQITHKKITTEEILEQRADARKYFQLLVNTLMDAISRGNTDPISEQPLRTALKQKSVSFYVNQINDLHNSSESLRFASVKGLRPQDLYYIITSAGEELYTSSYLGLYKRLMEHYPGRTANDLFELVSKDNLRVFLRLAANYNVLGDFLQNMPHEKMQQVLHMFISGIEDDESSALEKAMDIADSFTPVAASNEIGEVIQSELRSNLGLSKENQNYLGIRLYGILTEIFTLVKQDNGISKVWSRLGDYEQLKQQELKNRRGEIVEIVLFYGDDDGIASFSNFLKLYSDKSKWQTVKNEHWVSIRSVTNPLFSIYANLPLDISKDLDLKAQDEMLAYLANQSLEPTIIVHRGHSYHLDKTLRRLTPSVRLAILGSCGSYNKSISIASINPDVQVIGSKKTGSKSINDPIIDVINQTLVSRKDLVWNDIWKTLTAKFDNDPVTLALFNEYFPPSKNLGLFVLKLFMYYRGRYA
jgi:hypothetical protein